MKRSETMVRLATVDGGYVGDGFVDFVEQELGANPDDFEVVVNPSMDDGSGRLPRP